MVTLQIVALFWPRMTKRQVIPILSGMVLAAILVLVMWWAFELLGLVG